MGDLERLAALKREQNRVASKIGGPRRHAVVYAVVPSNQFHLFDAPVLYASLGERGIKIGIATSVTNSVWRSAEVHPEPTSKAYALSDKQRAMLQLFSRLRDCMRLPARLYGIPVENRRVVAPKNDARRAMYG